MERITTILHLRVLDAVRGARVSEVFEFYEICRQNRNFPTHAWYSDETEPGKASLIRKSKKIDEMEARPFPSTLADFRRVADELETLTGHLFHLEVMLSESVDPTQ
jgi:hypothetical protein